MAHGKRIFKKYVTISRNFTASCPYAANDKRIASKQTDPVCNTIPTLCCLSSIVEETKLENVLMSSSLETTLPLMQTSHFSMILFIEFRIESIFWCTSFHLLKDSKSSNWYEPSDSWWTHPIWVSWVIIWDARAADTSRYLANSFVRKQFNL